MKKEETLIYDKGDKFMKKIRGFERVTSKKKKTKSDAILPLRATSRSMAYDFFSNEDYEIETGEVVKIWTDVKSYMQQDECLIINIRSSMGGTFMLANTQGWIDSDYYSNENNDGNIGIFLLNISGKRQHIKKGDRIGQGCFLKYLIADNGNTEKVRVGGFGSSGK